MLDPNYSIVITGFIFTAGSLFLASQNSKKGAEIAANVAIVNQLNSQTDKLKDLEQRDQRCQGELIQIKAQLSVEQDHNLRLQEELNRVWRQLDDLRTRGNIAPT